MDLYAFLTPSRGPCDIRGVSLHYIDAEPPTCGFAEGQDHWTPSVDWWMSAKDFFEGEEGFSHLTIDKVREKYPNIIIFPNRKAAVRAWREAKENENIMRLYNEAVDTLIADFEEGADEDTLRYDIKRGRHWLFGAHHVLEGEASRLAWKAFMAASTGLDSPPITDWP